jgi:hypothetical protein
MPYVCCSGRFDYTIGIGRRLTIVGCFEYIEIVITVATVAKKDDTL